MSKKKRPIDQAVAASLAGVELARSRIEAFSYAIRGLEQYERDPINSQIGAVHTALYASLHRAYEKLFMWGLFDPSARSEGKRLALAKFLSESHSVMHYLDEDGKHPGRWLSSEEKAFREDIKRLERLT